MSMGSIDWSIYTSHPSFVLGFHGCDESVGEAILCGEKQHLKASNNDYDWLGHGVYFWESNPQRALEFAQECASGGKGSQGDIKTPFVLGAIIDLKCCLNLLDSLSLQKLKETHSLLSEAFNTMGKSLPSNGENKLQRKLDCSVIELLHIIQHKTIKPSFDTVRGMFTEGEELYPGAGFRTKDHTQICVRNVECIKGYFRPIHNPQPLELA